MDHSVSRWRLWSHIAYRAISRRTSGTRLNPPLGPASGKNQVPLGGVGGDPGSFRTPEHVHLAPNPDLARQGDPGFDREPDSLDQLPVIVGFVVVEMGTRAMQVAIDRMPGAVHEVVTPSPLLVHAPRVHVRLEPGNGPRPAG